MNKRIERFIDGLWIGILGLASALSGGMLIGLAMGPAPMPNEAHVSLALLGLAVAAVGALLTGISYLTCRSAVIQRSRNKASLDASMQSAPQTPGNGVPA